MTQPVVAVSGGRADDQCVEVDGGGQGPLNWIGGGVVGVDHVILGHRSDVFRAFSRTSADYTTQVWLRTLTRYSSVCFINKTTSDGVLFLVY